MPEALPGTTVPINPGLGQAPNMLACTPGGLVQADSVKTLKTNMSVKLEYMCVSSTVVNQYNCQQ